MTLPFNTRIINDGSINPKDFKYANFIGFLNSVGKAIDYSKPLGLGGHDKNYITELFKVFFPLKIKESKHMSPLEIHIMSNEYLERERKQKINSLNERINKTKEKLIDYNNYGWENYITYSQLELDLYYFLLNCYSGDTFFKGLGKNVDTMCQHEFFLTQFSKRNIPNQRFDVSDQDFEFEYWYYQTKTILSVFKDVMVQYLGYHSVERLPRTITTSEFNIYETFYNYLLNDYNIVQIPKMFYDDNKKMYIEYTKNNFLVSDKELRLKDEVQAIKKLVPPEKRYQYYR